MHIHILGICGTFMGGIAVIARQAGYRVTGCDANVYPPMSTQLQAQGIHLIEGWDPKQIDLKPDLFVVGNVVSRGNPLIEEILDRGLPYVSGPQWLAENVLRSKWVLGVAGTHGKTTTSAMLAWILQQGGLNPGFLIGGVPINFDVSARETGSAFFVIEADEYDTAFFDKRSKFLHYRPRTAVLNNLEFDHADIFPDVAAIETQFHHLVRTVPGNGLIVAHGREATIRRVIERGCWTPVEWLGTADGWAAGDPADDGAFEVFFNGKPQGRVHWALLGEHNRMNALAALAAARHAGIPVARAVEALSTFRNVKRRMELRGTAGGVTVYDDFAHHPTAIEATIAGLRKQVGGARILAVLEPRSNTMKLGAMKEALPGSLAAADRVFCYTDGLKWDARAVLSPLGARAECHGDLETLVKAIVAAARAGDQVVIMSNGAFGGIHARLLEALARR
ncbi:MAG TPA: UDP-N-acetylmuramate:L-alanyl-gamma-D-glutamyl-meso-diaminopimelate ligase [Burkholderiales bacterium]|jgi:UDP-N-acetylmuramate: L-alanyl-gamma-D-glutamyl-meso-diaminopimelate ligase|nr:UDP-N-acetylmuramate:L-alanyl-gamma-D-glutamyl-meso-diaminopimelate ligase [Burkholderiales bacterium]